MRKPCTEVGQVTQTKLALISEQAHRDKKLQFTSLAHLLNASFLELCYYQLGRDRASGIDGVSWQSYGEQLQENLRDLESRLKGKRYRPLPARRTYIPKNEHEKRPLGIPAIEDKIVQKGISRILEAIYEADFMDCSYGFRPGRNPHQAINAVDKTMMTRPINHVVEADIKGFFDHVSHEWMMKFLQVRIKDPSLLLLIRRFLKAGYIESGHLAQPDEGTPQGGNLSPLLANIFLHYVLDLWFIKKIAPALPGEALLVRYADDFVCQVGYATDAQAIMHALQERFGKFGLELHPEKTRVISFGRYERENAKRQMRRTNTFDFLGFTHYCDVSRKGNFKLGRKSSRKKFLAKCRVLNLWLKGVRNAAKVKDWWPTLRSKLRGHYQYYGISGNYRSLGRYYSHAVRLTFKWINRRSQYKSFSWQAFFDYLEHYPLPKPKIMHNIYTLSPVV